MLKGVPSVAAETSACESSSVEKRDGSCIDRVGSEADLKGGNLFFFLLPLLPRAWQSLRAGELGFSSSEPMITLSGFRLAGGLWGGG